MPTANNTLTTPDLTSLEARKRLAKIIVALFDHWELRSSEQALLLGHSPTAITTLSRYRKGLPVNNKRDLIGRIGHLLGIHKTLRTIFPHDRDLAYKWVSTPSRRFGGKKPVEIMTKGYEGLLVVRSYLDYERDRDVYP